MPKARPGRKPHYPTFLKQWRELRGLRRNKLAEMSDLSNGAISQLEAGDTLFAQLTLEDLADALQCRPGDILSTDPTRFDQLDELYLRLARAPQDTRDQAARVLAAVLDPDAAKHEADLNAVLPAVLAPPRPAKSLAADSPGKSRTPKSGVAPLIRQALRAPAARQPPPGQTPDSPKPAQPEARKSAPKSKRQPDSRKLP
jgi:transcriptional regulator with XRE-family HTH domain